MKKSELILLIVFVITIIVISSGNNKLFNILLFIFGIYFTIFGIRLLLQKGFVERLRKGMWKSEEDKKYMTEKEGYVSDKYMTGLFFLAISSLRSAFVNICFEVKPLSTSFPFLFRQII